MTLRPILRLSNRKRGKQSDGCLPRLALSNQVRRRTAITHLNSSFVNRFSYLFGKGQETGAQRMRRLSLRAVERPGLQRVHQGQKLPGMG
jgi:hypothetical protein